MSDFEKMNRPRRQRRYPRFIIEKPEVLRGAIGPLCPEFRLVSFSEGGAGFVTTSIQKTLIPPLQVYCQFLFPAYRQHPFRLDADLLYCFESYEWRGESGVFYGVEFRDKKNYHLPECISVLENLALESQVVFEAKDV